MKRYYVKYTRNFANTYDLRWAETGAQKSLADAHGYTMITRAKAESLCRSEIYRRRYDKAISGYAPTVILPIDYSDYDALFWQDDRGLEKRGYIVERV